MRKREKDINEVGVTQAVVNEICSKKITEIPKICVLLGLMRPFPADLEETNMTCLNRFYKPEYKQLILKELIDISRSNISII